MFSAGNDVKKKEKTQTRLLKLFLKLAVTAFCFWYISKKIDFSRALSVFSHAHLTWLLLALFFFIFSKILSSIRLNIYFRNISLQLPEITNLKLYWLGMFYNLFLPGAISGDAYKVILLKRKYNADYRKTSAAVLLDRFSGVLALGFILVAYGLIVLNNRNYEILLIAGAILAFGFFYLLVARYFKDFLPGFMPTFFWGLVVQLCQVICIYFILRSLQLPLIPEWIFIFLASAVISVLPISLGGGLGTREVVFAEGAHFFHLDPQLGVAISLLFYLITVAGSAGGLYYSFKNPLE
ncbi:MAG: lysylphosphatidylglycerol synthase transmembrane domain-containing protein [Cytophagaceae bacterium]|jgi:uncharacterized membrane protein YbhN (UPF0104 family)